MDNYILHDGATPLNLAPFTLNNPVADLRMGIFTFKERWERVLEKKVSIQSIVHGINSTDAGNQKKYAASFPDGTSVHFKWELFALNDMVIRHDYKILTLNRKSQPLNVTNRHIGNQLFIEEGARINCAILNSTTGPIYIGKNAEVMEGAMIRGPVALCNNSVVKMGAKIYGATTVGPFSKVGGELNNVVIMGYSNKAHDGFLGNSVIGYWCNIGADTNNSNLKNNYGNVKVWDYYEQKMVDSGLQFCGLFMGDYSKCGINTMFNTGTVVGVSANVYGAGFPEKFIPSFTWGGVEDKNEFDFEKACTVAKRMMERRQINFSAASRQNFQRIFKDSSGFRDTYCQ